MEHITVLLIEPAPEDAHFLWEALVNGGRRSALALTFEVVYAERLSTGLARLDAGGIDVVLLTLMLPDSQGLETLVGLYHHTSDLPVVVLTALDDEALAAQAVQMGAQDYVVKGHLDSHVLMHVLHSAIERHRLLMALQASERRWRHVTVGNADSIIVVDRAGVVRFVNPAAEALFGRKADAFLGTALGFSVTPGETTEVDIVGRPGSIVAEMRVAEIAWDGDLAYLASLRDITQRLRMEEQLAAQAHALTLANRRLQEMDQLKSEFLATMSHELRTPLNTIIGFTGTMLHGLTGPLTAEQQTQLSIVASSAQHLLSLVNDTLDLSAMEANATTLVAEPFAFAEVVTEVTQEVAPQIAQQGLQLCVEPPEASRSMVSDRRRVLQVLSNLVTNAVKFTAQGEVRIAYTYRAEHLDVCVSDTGIGISREHMAMLFERFWQVQGTARRCYAGVGLGLYLCKKLVTLLGGEIWAESVAGQGSRFMFTLPLTRREVRE